jgi:hypothetical protein
MRTATGCPAATRLTAASSRIVRLRPNQSIYFLAPEQKRQDALNGEELAIRCSGSSGNCGTDMQPFNGSRQ